MRKNKIILLLFIIVAMVQLFVPASMIIDRENVIKNGNKFNFLTEPVDPNDPFHGKYIDLAFTETEFPLNSDTSWVPNETVFVILETDKDGFARIQSVSKEKPQNSTDYIKARVYYVRADDANTMVINYPFSRFYMQETKAQNAEDQFRKAQRNNTKSTYAIISVLNGKAVILDIMIDNVSVTKLAKP